LSTLKKYNRVTHEKSSMRIYTLASHRSGKICSLGILLEKAGWGGVSDGLAVFILRKQLRPFRR
jgi:hypothetical protein